MKTTIAVLALCGLCFAQSAQISAGKSIFIEKMDNGLDGYIQAEMIKQHVPLKVVLTAEEADLVMTGTSSEERQRKWHEGWLTIEKDRTEGNVMVADRSAKVLLWASEAGDRSLWKGSLARGGQRKVAERVVGNFKKIVK
jgi:hypothetical protein